MARAALNAGATIINDISALSFDPDMAPLAAEMQAPVVLMHMQGTPRDMQRQPHYHDLLGEIRDFFRERLDFAASQGLPPELLVLDPGIGFGKTWRHNLAILNHLEVFLDLGCPVLVGASRKAFIGHILDLPAGEERDVGTLAALAVAVMRGARIVRTHNVAYAAPVPGRAGGDSHRPGWKLLPIRLLKNGLCHPEPARIQVSAS